MFKKIFKNMTLWKVSKHYLSNDNHPTYLVTPHDFCGYIKCCRKWFGLRGLSDCYLFKKQAKNKADRLNKQVKRKYGLKDED